ncbi:MAG: hypothetical protein EOP88_07730 [Verrucomicrobiaceae bacterium]|nr:MAG: hypothetical protein EOP88_07730 [Verrucomicrobiaceae bacterium]
MRGLLRLSAIILPLVALPAAAGAAADGDWEFWRKLDRSDAAVEEAREFIIAAAEVAKQEEAKELYPDKALELFLEEDRKTREKLPLLQAERVRLAEEAQVLARPDGDHFADPLLDARLELDLYRFIWEAVAPDVTRQRKKVITLAAQLPPVPPRESLVHLWQRIILAETGMDEGWRPGDDNAAFRLIFPEDTMRKLRLKYLREYLEKVRKQLDEK